MHFTNTLGQKLTSVSYQSFTSEIMPEINEAETKQSFSLPAGAGSICTKRETALSHFLDTVSSTVIRGGN